MKWAHFMMMSLTSFHATTFQDEIRPIDVSSTFENWLLFMHQWHENQMNAWKYSQCIVVVSPLHRCRITVASPSYVCRIVHMTWQERISVVYGDMTTGFIEYKATETVILKACKWHKLTEDGAKLHTIQTALHWSTIVRSSEKHSTKYN